MIGLHRHNSGAQLPRIAHQGARLDAERLGRVAGGDRHGGIRHGLHDDDGLSAQGRVFLLLARRKEGVRSRNSHCTGLSTACMFIVCSIRYAAGIFKPNHAAALCLPPRGFARVLLCARELPCLRTQGHHSKGGASAGPDRLHTPDVARTAAPLSTMRGERKGLSRRRITAARLKERDRETWWGRAGKTSRRADAPIHGAKRVEVSVGGTPPMRVDLNDGQCGTPASRRSVMTVRNSSRPIARVFRATAAPGCRDELLQRFHSSSAALVNSKVGCLKYRILEPVDASAPEVVFESIWRDLDAVKVAFGDAWQQSHLPEGYSALMTAYSVHHFLVSESSTTEQFASDPRT